MAKYRIVKQECTSLKYNENTRKNEQVTYVSYHVQKRVFGILWWYDPLDDGYWSDGVFATFEEAEAALNNLITKPKYTVIKEL